MIEDYPSYPFIIHSANLPSVMSTPSSNPSDLIPFSIDHLLIAGLIIDRGQLSPSQREELNRRTVAGTLINEKWWKSDPSKDIVVWRLPNVKIPYNFLFST